MDKIGDWPPGVDDEPDPNAPTFVNPFTGGLHPGRELHVAYGGMIPPREVVRWEGGGEVVRRSCPAEVVTPEVVRGPCPTEVVR